ncbi:hypothetical protein [Methanococcoides methylutens]|uniref:Uncharacterized protein n=1 Tax=Methanococcoides methylutens MM1 TaxID=1434104 RepID=A0A0E3SSD0_METMT|nr:hypothetical protein [Methanococcoides methylutens]AKB85413.1 hypothetical protein MCMEM_1360 [Methanococcoides methylutens MM1]
MKHIIIQSDKVTEPTLAMLIPKNISAELQKEIEDHILEESIDEEKLTETYDTIGDQAELLRYKDVKDYMNKYNLKFNEDSKGWDLEGEDNDWLFVFSDMIENSQLQLVDNVKFNRGLEYTLFSSLIGLLIAKGCEMKYPGSTMVGINHNRRGLVWIRYPDKNMTIVLRKGIYSDVDRLHKIVYSKDMPGVDEALSKGLINEDQVRSSTFGNYPYYLIEDLEYDDLDDPDYIRDILKHAMSL